MQSVHENFMDARWTWLAALAVGLVCTWAGAACSPVGSNLGNLDDAGRDLTDHDGDGYSEATGDCDDHNAAIYPTAPEVIDGVDNNCDGKVDDDLDGDGWGVQDGDCDDADPSVHPLAAEICVDGIDNNCNGYVDDQEPDLDGDGFGPCDLPVGDCNEGDPMIGPGSVEDLTDGVDNDCDGLVDGDDTNDFACDCQATEPGEPIEHQILRALGLCNQSVVLNASLNGNAVAYGAYESWGALHPRTAAQFPAVEGLPEQNCQFVILSTGPARTDDPQDGPDSDLGISGVPDPAPAAGQDGAVITDLTQLVLQIRVPPNVTGFSFDFIFFSAEYPEYVCTEYNDTFYALVEGDPALGSGQRTNISFDSAGHEVTVNNAFFEYQIPPWSIDISGTGYEVADSWAAWTVMPEAGCTLPSYAAPQYRGSMSGWLRTTSPLTPGETVTLTFSIHDEGDHVLDSAVVLDNFQWQTVPIDGPGTVK